MHKLKVDYIKTAPRGDDLIILGYYKEKNRNNYAVSDAVVFVGATWKPRLVWNNDTNCYERHRNADTDGSWVDYANRLLVKVAESSGERGNFPRYWSNVPNMWNSSDNIPRTGEYVLLRYTKGTISAHNSWETGYVQAKWKPRKVWSKIDRTWITSIQGKPFGEWVDYSNRIISQSWATNESKNIVTGWLPLPEVIENV